MRPLLLVALSLVTVNLCAAQSNIRRSNPDRVTIRRQRIVLVRSAKFAQQFPDRKRATIDLPVISGLNPAVLGKVRSILQPRNIFDSSVAEYRRDTWLDELTFVVDYNQNYVLDITFTQSGMAAYPDSQSKHFAIDLQNGTVLKAADVFVDHKLESLSNMVDAKLQREVVELVEEARRDPHMDREEAQNVVDALEQQKFEVQNLNDFSVGKDGITFLYDAGFPHVIQALEPEGRYFFSYAELKSFIKPEGRLGQFIR